MAWLLDRATLAVYTEELKLPPRSAPRNPRDGTGKALLPLSPADVLNASLPLLLELHVSLDSLLQVQDRGILYDDHSCMNTYRRRSVWDAHPKPQAMGDTQGSALAQHTRHGLSFSLTSSANILLP